VNLAPGKHRREERLRGKEKRAGFSGKKANCTCYSSEGRYFFPCCNKYCINKLSITVGANGPEYDILGCGSSLEEVRRRFSHLILPSVDKDEDDDDDNEAMRVVELKKSTKPGITRKGCIAPGYVSMVLETFAHTIFAQ
jgi:hypothetical protein